MQPRDRPDEIEITEAMIEAGVDALSRLIPMEEAFRLGGEEAAVAETIRAALAARRHTCRGSPARSSVA
ncbi:hypothetical protein, partial [Brevundimonas sp.]|uniref:hypothetical protein n=1 Tax=Brevundimonas sp. TaxID=1871086 RepID=UPI002D336586